MLELKYPRTSPACSRLAPLNAHHNMLQAHRIKRHGQGNEGYATAIGLTANLPPGDFLSHLALISPAEFVVAGFSRGK